MSVERVLEKNKVDYKPTGDSLQVHCLNTEHEDNNPSMFINKYTGWAKCMSCGASYNVFTLFNEKADWITVRKEQFREKLRKTAFDSQYLEFPDTAVFWTGSFRGISEKTLVEFQAFQCADFPGYICFPIKNASGRIINFIGRDTSGVRKPKYLLFHKRPVKMAPVANNRHGSVILVEGWFDFLNLYDKGLTNVRALFGTTTFHEESVDYLKVEGVTEVVIMMDSDDAGNKAATEIKEKLDTVYISNKKITLASGTDPGDLDQKSVTAIKEKLYGKSSNSRDQAEPEQLQS